MSIKSWSVANFKGVEKAFLPLDGVSALAGANSAGKSSLTQSLLLLAQSQTDDIVLNGPLVRFGSSTDVIHEASDHVQLSWVSRIAGRSTLRGGKAGELRCSITLKRPKPAKTTDQTSLVVSDLLVERDGHCVFEANNERVEAKTLAARNPDSRWGDSLLRVRTIDGAPAPNRTYVTFSGFFPSVAIYKTTPEQLAKKIKGQIAEFAPTTGGSARWLVQDILLTYASMVKDGDRPGKQPAASLTPLQQSILELDADDPTKDAEHSSLIDQMAEDVASGDDVVLPLGTKSSRRAGIGVLGRPMDDIVPQSHRPSWGMVIEAFRDLHDLGRRVRYMGPLREEPQVLSTTGGRNDTVPAGLRGEYTADMLFRNRSSMVSYSSPTGEARTSHLQEAVGEWASWLGVGQSVRVTDQGKLGRGILVEVDGKERDLTTIGVGVSQLLPVITVLLAAPRGSILVFEQPELHLHPAIQSRLANFFEAARKDVSIVIETHSEYLITRLRRLRVDADDGSRPIHFVFAKPGAYGARIEPLGKGNYGDIGEWPVGFFDTQEEEERKLLVALGKRAKESRK